MDSTNRSSIKQKQNLICLKVHLIMYNIVYAYVPLWYLYILSCYTIYYLEYFYDHLDVTKISTWLLPNHEF